MRRSLRASASWVKVEQIFLIIGEASSSHSYRVTSVATTTGSIQRIEQHLTKIAVGNRALMIVESQFLLRSRATLEPTTGEFKSTGTLVLIVAATTWLMMFIGCRVVDRGDYVVDNTLKEQSSMTVNQ